MSDKEPRKFYWQQVYEFDGRKHWALCDSQTDSEPKPIRVTCPYMILIAHHPNGFNGQSVDEQYFPALIAQLLTEHYAKLRQADL